MNYLAFSGLSTAICGVLCSIFAIRISPRTYLRVIWSLFSLSMGTWGLGLFFAFTSADEKIILFWSRFLNISAITIPVLFFHFILLLTNKYILRKNELISYYFVTTCYFITAIAFPNLFVPSVTSKLSFSYYPSAGYLYYFFPIWFGYLVMSALAILILEYIKSTQLKKMQLKYVLIGSLLGFSGGSTTFPLVFDIKIYPFGVFQVPFYLSLITYAIIKYRLMDIRIALSRAGIFVIVYSLVLGFPLWMGYKHHLWQQATWMMLILATAGPTIYLYLQRKAEERMLQEEKQIQRLLKNSSQGMRTIKDLQKLLDTILDLVFDALKVTHTSIYLLNTVAEQYVVRATKDQNKTPGAIDIECVLIQELKNKKNPLICEEIKFHTDGDSQKVSENILSQMGQLQATVILPILTHEILLGFLVLGEREGDKVYSQELLDTLLVMSDHAALAIENCQYLEAQTKRMEEEGFHERIASLDMMASSFAHEIDNPMAVVKSETEFLSNEFFEEIKDSLTEAKQTEFKEILTYILESSIRVSAMIKAIEEYSRMGTGELKPVRINDAADGFLTLISPQFKKEKIKFTQNVEDKLPFVLGEKVQLEEIFMNFATNAMHAVRNQKEKLITSKVFRKDEGTVRVEFSDNGYGIPQNIINDIFLASVTTKGSSEGTGLGLFRVRKIVDLHKGKVWAQSQGEGQGAKFIVELPIYKGDIRDTIKNNNNH